MAGGRPIRSESDSEEKYFPLRGMSSLICRPLKTSCARPVEAQFMPVRVGHIGVFPAPGHPFGLLVEIDPGRLQLRAE